MQQPSVHLEDKPSLLQQMVYELEAYKRRLGRNFDRATNHHQRVYYFSRYNNIENMIQEICATHGLQRKYKPHKLDINKV